MPRPLPLDLLPLIVTEAAGPPSKLDYTTLVALCLTSKDLLPLARAALYRRVVAEFGSDMDSGGQQPYLWLNDVGLAICNHSHLASRVIELEVELQEVERNAEHLVPDGVARLLKNCRSLQMLKLESTRFNPYTLDDFAGALLELDLFTNLVELRVVHTGPNTLRLLYQCNNLRRLEVLLGSIVPDPTPLSQTPFTSLPFYLERLAIERDLPLPIFHVITSNSVLSLRILHLDSEDLLRFAEPIAELPSLDELCISHQRLHGQYPSTFTLELSSALHNFNSLRTLTILALRQAPVPLDLISRLPLNVVALYLSRVCMEDILSLLGSHACGRLSKLAVGEFHRFGSDWTTEKRRLLAEAAGQARVELVPFWWDRFDFW